MDWMDGGISPHSRLISDEDSVTMSQRSDAGTRIDIDTDANATDVVFESNLNSYKPPSIINSEIDAFTPDESEVASRDTKTAAVGTETPLSVAELPRQITIMHDVEKWNQIFREKVAQAEAKRRTNDSEKLLIREKHPLSTFAFLGGCAVVLLNIFDLFFELIHFDIFEVFMSAYILAFGVTICIIEGSLHTFPAGSSSFQVMLSYAKFLKHVLGRGSFYFFVGTMQASKKSIMDIILGGYFVILGLMIVIVGLIASKKVSTSALPNSRDSLLEIFHTYDSDKDGFLEYQEFGDILKAWGANLSADDLELACYAVDQDYDEKISQQEFANWWESVQNFTPENSSTMV